MRGGFNHFIVITPEPTLNLITHLTSYSLFFVKHILVVIAATQRVEAKSHSHE